MANQMEAIIQKLNDKAGLKQDIFSHVQAVFKQFKQRAERIQSHCAPRILENPKVEIEINSLGDFEFHLKFSGDTLVFILHTNVFCFPPEHQVNKSKLVQENPNHGFFGMIQMYNFLSDSIKYNRSQDMGYLLARVFVNGDNYFYVDGARQLDFLYKEISNQQLGTEEIEKIIEQCMLYCLDFDLYVPGVDMMNQITINQKNYFNAAGGLATGKRLGFITD